MMNEHHSTLATRRAADPLLSQGTVTASQFGCRPSDIWYALEVAYLDSHKSLAIILATLPRSQNQADPAQARPHSLQ